MKTSAEPPSRPRWKQWLIETLDLTSQSREDLLEELQRATEKNLLSGETVDMLQGVLAFGAIQVRDIMVPRSRVHFLNREDSFAAVLQAVTTTEHSRYPVIQGDKDDLVGILLVKDLLKYIGREDAFAMNTVLRPALIIPESQRLNRLLAEFRHTRNHMAVVIDEYSGIAGVVTFEDVLEQIVGDIDDEYDDQQDEPGKLVAHADGRFEVDATLLIDDFNQALGTHLDSAAFTTIGGIVVHAFGRIPQQGDGVVLEGRLFRVLKSDNRRIQWLEVLPFPENTVAEPSLAL